jgi:hypothetical protein
MAVAAGALALPLRATADDGGPCTASKFHFASVEKACKEGGRKSAKDVMKAAVKRARADGKEYKCNSCHDSQTTYSLKSDAIEKYKPYAGS